MPPEATWVIAGARSGPSAATAMIDGDDEVDRDHVDGALGDAGELVEQAAGVGDEHRLGHAEPADPAGLRLGQSADSMIDGRTIDTGTRTLDVGQRLLAERLRERVGVGPADAGGTGAAGLDQLVLDPAFAELLGLRGERRGAGGAEFGAGLGAELLEPFAGAARGVGVGAQAPAGGHLVAPVDADVERAVAHELLGCVAAAVAGDVARRHGDEVRGDADGVAEVGDARRPEQVDLDGRVERRVERDRCRRVDHGVARGEDRPIGVVQAEAVAGDVAGDRW